MRSMDPEETALNRILNETWQERSRSQCATREVLREREQSGMLRNSWRGAVIHWVNIRGDELWQQQLLYALICAWQIDLQRDGEKTLSTEHDESNWLRVIYELPYSSTAVDVWAELGPNPCWLEDLGAAHHGGWGSR